MTTTLSQSLRELQRFLDQSVGVTAIAESRQAGHKILLDCIAQAEAMEGKAGEWSDGDVEAAYLMGAINASGHEPRGETHWPSMDRVKAELDRIKANGWKIADMVRQVRGKASIQPSQAIGAQTPVAWHGPGEFPPDPIPEGHMLIGYSTRKAKDEEYGLRRLACYAPKGPWTDGYGSVPNPSWWAIIPIPEKDESRWYMPTRSPISPEARDRAIEALESAKKMLLLTKIVHKSVECGKSADLCD